ncbi:MAG: hypothetical protein A2700_00310 [Candidatus Blackburnbacteria bacterium RIFCSPHIGHO2_01_FULL_44_64]|uniref:Trigger factor n=1 Tax=Candidatus Blackburnbacteria bacterium RIFCSPHIGHO2_02_FULL_44_20 TaxID=1797516 RepID=A0A1G1V7V7_9BACT|nr:MAG: hypothetical protein A2700_00310 [Candidatus Blackburnbacteria bacterium RIFCSPHIGHO2_01_FULL_44_64]OGY10220.1 MAG: hypothetical protein A3E16_03355 [Candidatus Blackburnbacteria bacterium RIFCSPHIGHO2_12_FULL_44_25]OGY11361.1 MAG: hypothetical protein A3D26_02550 [Candidatus Blackburnbacteria bacterium RIFCSPHIGHO2_02_FULL_44_20]OGY13537.1 MAG: hypothetical protein A3A62_00975 [Candidatus Blackburnbacteria bacterium RIFCSPLOWO2_01_FULL_44_43]OGY16497.1 MAG: hypothetical protein A3H88_0
MAAKQKPISVLARESNGNIQITLTIPHPLVQEEKEEALQTLTARLEIPGFRPGKAPRDIAEKRIDKQDLYNEMLQKLLPDVYADSVEEHNLRPILAPRFEIVSIDENNDWTVRALTCELPTVDVGDYRKNISGTLSASKIVVPGKNDPKDKKESSREDKEQKILESLIQNTKSQIAPLLIKEEVNHKLAKLLDQTQKLGLTVEQYLASTGKTTEGLRAELAQQANDAIKLELALNKIADEEKISVEDSEVEQLVTASGQEKPEEVKPQQKAMIKGVLKRRKALDRLLTLS